MKPQKENRPLRQKQNKKAMPEIQTYQNKRNPYAISLHRLEQKMKEVNLHTFWDLRDIMDALPHLGFKEGYMLDGCMVGDRRNATMKLYAYKQDSRDKYIPGKRGVHLNPEHDVYDFECRYHWYQFKRKIKAPVPFRDGQVIEGTVSSAAFDTVPALDKYLVMDFTPEAIWEAVLLIKEARNYLAHRWHGSYSNGRLIVDSTSLIQSCTGKLEEEAIDTWLRYEHLYPSVKIIDDNHAVVNYCRWGDWRGLTNTTIDVVRSGKSICFEKEVITDLVKYDCGIRF